MNTYNEEYYDYGAIDIFINDSNRIGERVSCILRIADIEKYSDNDCFDTSLAILCNNCGIESGISQLTGLEAGQIIPIQFNGEDNPTVPLNWVTSKFWEL